jgi:hypothetical protein
MKFDIVSRRRAKKEEGNFHGEGRGGDRQQRRPQQRPWAPRRALPQDHLISRAAFFQTSSPCNSESMPKSTFNPDFNILKIADKCNCETYAPWLGIGQAVCGVEW